MNTEVRIAGFGGQGIVLSAIIIGKAASIFHNGHATMTQSFGPEARGGSSSTQLILSDRPILYPYVRQTDILVALSQEALSRFTSELKPDGILLVEQDLVRLTHTGPGVRAYGVPATRLAEQLGKHMVLNVVMVGFFAAVTRLLDSESLRSALSDSVPPNTVTLNLNAFDAGFDYGLSVLDSRDRNDSADLAHLRFDGLA
jgi:2-oxoglutarate ferredoxin oxidoreductase subunit gamma